MSQQSSPGYWKTKFAKLAGGPPNLEKIAGKSWLALHRSSLSGMALFLAGFVGPEMVTWYNGFPALEELETHQVTIVAVQEKDPHFAVDMADGSRKIMEWPVPVSYYGGFPSYAWSKEQRQLLPGCQAEIQGVPMRWTIRERYRIWSLDCPEKGIRITTERITKDYAGWINPSKFIWFIPFSYCLFLLVVFIRESRGNL